MPTHAELMVEALEAEMLANASVLEVTIRGRTVRYASVEKRDAAYKRWKVQVAREQGARPISPSIDLSGF